MGLQARMLNKAIKKMNPVNKNSVILAINQTRVDIGNPYGGGMQEKLVGGVGQYFHASLILQTRRKGWLLETKDGKIVEDEKASKKAKKVGFVISCVVQKSNYCPPHVSCDIPFNFYSGQLYYGQEHGTSTRKRSLWACRMFVSTSKRMLTSLNCFR
jgi:RecA/RadA recombinase